MPDQYPFSADRYILVGRVSKPHGLKGEIKVMVLAGRAEDFSEYSRVALVATDGRMTRLLDLVQARIQAKQVILKLDTIDTRNEADLTVGMGVLLSRDELSESAERSMDRNQLAGLSVRCIADTDPVGIVESFFHNGAQEIMVVRDNDREFLIPLIKEIIVEYNDNEIVIDPPPGLLDLSSDPDN